MNDHSRIKISIIIILITSVLTFSGCSFIMSENKFMPKVDETKWKKTRINPYSYTLNSTHSRYVFQYSKKEIVITIPSYYDKDTCGISIGPWLLPIVPTFFSCLFLDNNKDFNFKFIIENFGDPITIDIQGTKLIKLGGQVVTPQNVNYMSPEIHYPYTDNEKYFFYYPDSYMKPCSSPVFIGKGGRILVSIDYANINRNEEFKIEFGDVSSIEKSSNLPHINFVSGNVIVFCPIVFVGHEPCAISDDDTHVPAGR